MPAEIQHHQRERSVGYSDAVLLTTRPGEMSYRQPFAEAYFRPGPNPLYWGNRSCYPYMRFVPTSDAEMSQFARHGRGYYSYVQRYSLRTDGFASVNAPLAGGELLMRPLTEHPPWDRLRHAFLQRKHRWARLQGETHEQFR